MCGAAGEQQFRDIERRQCVKLFIAQRFDLQERYGKGPTALDDPAGGCGRAGMGVPGNEPRHEQIARYAHPLHVSGNPAFDHVLDHVAVDEHRDIVPDVHRAIVDLDQRSACLDHVAPARRSSVLGPGRPWHSQGSQHRRWEHRSTAKHRPAARTTRRAFCGLLCRRAADYAARSMIGNVGHSIVPASQSW